MKLTALSKKAIAACLRRMGYEIFPAKARGSMSYRARPHRINVAARYHPQPLPALLRAIHPTRYFTIRMKFEDAGINHLKAVLQWMLIEALALGRRPVLFAPRLGAVHNLGRSISPPWNKYINTKTVSVSQMSLEAPVEILDPLAEEDLRNMTILRWNQNTIVSNRANRQYDMVIRESWDGLHFNLMQGPGEEGLTVNLNPSAAVEEVYQKVATVFGEYSAMHVRRGTKLKEKQQYPNLEDDTKPEAIQKILRDILPKGEVLYVLTDEADRNYFDMLKRRYNIVRYFDFEVLRNLVETDNPDNYLLYEVEKLIFEKARTQVFTFRHPEGKERHCLTQDPGWS